MPLAYGSPQGIPPGSIGATDPADRDGIRHVTGYHHAMIHERASLDGRGVDCPCIAPQAPQGHQQHEVSHSVNVARGPVVRQIFGPNGTR